MSLAHKCVTLEGETAKASQVVDLEKEISLLNEDLVEERCLKDGSISKAQFGREKASKFSQQLAKYEESLNRIERMLSKRRRML